MWLLGRDLPGYGRGLLHITRRLWCLRCLRSAFDTILTPKLLVFLSKTLSAFALLAEISRLLRLDSRARHCPVGRSERAYEGFTE